MSKEADKTTSITRGSASVQKAAAEEKQAEKKRQQKKDDDDDLPICIGSGNPLSKDSPELRDEDMTLELEDVDFLLGEWEKGDSTELPPFLAAVVGFHYKC